MSSAVAEHQLHPHRYANSHHPSRDLREDKILIVSREKATACEHKLINAAGCSEHDGSHTSETTAALIKHLEQHSTEWVEKFTAAINGGEGGLTQKFSFHRTQPIVGDASDDPNSALAILEKFGV